MVNASKRKIKKCRPQVGFPKVYVESVRRYLREESGRPVKSRMKAGRDQLGLLE